ncbi:hypothetical protein CsSME_00039226 [Camellia sinensis var. sinensis]
MAISSANSFTAPPPIISRSPSFQACCIGL